MDCAFIFDHLCRAPSLFGMCLFHLSGVAEIGPWDSQGVTESSNRGVAECLAGAKHIHLISPRPPFPRTDSAPPLLYQGGTCNISLIYKHAIGIKSPHFPFPPSCKCVRSTLWLISLHFTKWHCSTRYIV